MRSARGWIAAIFAAMLMFLQAGGASAAPQVGWWWNPSESGRGFFIEMKDQTLFMAGYFYEASGRGTWAVSGGSITDTNSFTGRMLAVSGGQTLVGPYVAPPSAVDIGQVTLTFTDETHGTLTWPGGTTTIERQVFGTGTASVQPSGWWWNPAESGRGFSVEVQGDTMDIVAFMYDAAGNPVWYISSGKMTTPSAYTGTLLAITGGQVLNGPYKAPTAVTPAGRITMNFASLESATFTLSDEVAGGGPGKTVTTIVQPQLANPPLSSLPARWGGTYSGIAVNDPPGTDILTATADGDVQWTQTTAAPPGVTFATTVTPNQAYVISGGTAKVHITGTASLPVAGQNVTCAVEGDQTVTLASALGNSYLLFEANGTVTGQIATLTPILFAAKATCATPFGPVVINQAYPLQLTIPLHGRHRYSHSEGSDPLHPINGQPNLSAGATWSFNALP